MSQLSYPTITNPSKPMQQRELRAGIPSMHSFSADDGTQLRLTRYQGGTKGPVILVHCIGVSSTMYSTTSIETNLLEYLYANGYDVWLLDFRFSIELPASNEQSTFDDIARRDYPAAVAKVRELTGAGTVQVVAHGVGSSTFTMAMLAGLQGVRSAVCSQVSTHVLVPAINRMKVLLRMPSMLAAAGVKTMTAYVSKHPGWKTRLYDTSLKLYPVAGEERCDSAVCRRITSMYGVLYEHDQLSTATHRSLGEMFGVVNMKAFRQLALITRKSHLVDVNGNNSYLPHLERLAIPIAFIHGAENECVLPKSTEITYNLLREKNGKELYSRHLIPKYGHVDCIIGKDAARDVYPIILKHLEGTAA